jgi:hypothetical protein
MRTREKQRIFKRFMKGESIYQIALSRIVKYQGNLNDATVKEIGVVQQAIRSCVLDEIAKRKDAQ